MDDSPLAMLLKECDANRTRPIKEKPVAPPKRLWDNYEIIGEVQKSTYIKVVVGAGIRDGVRYINVREFYLIRKDDTWMPGRDGITIPLIMPVDDGMKRLTPWVQLAEMMESAVFRLNSMELYDEEKVVYATRRGAKQNDSEN